MVCGTNERMAGSLAARPIYAHFDAEVIYRRGGGTASRGKDLPYSIPAYSRTGALNPSRLACLNKN